MAAPILAHPTQDDGVFQTLRAIELLRRAGTIEDRHYQKGFAILSSAAGVRCACGAVPALITPPGGGPAVCGRCYQETA